MAIERWIWGNANLKDAGLQEFQVRLCDAGLQAYKDSLIRLSNRLASTEKRKAELTAQQCWFAGYLDAARTVYVAALAGEQNQLLGARMQGSRGLVCVFALGFLGEDIQRYRQDEGLFEPLKEIMKAINETGRCDAKKDAAALAVSCRDYKDTECDAVFAKMEYNIVKSTPDMDTALWRQSLNRPVMTGILSVDDAEKLLDIFPHGAVTVAENAAAQYRSRGNRDMLEHWKKQEEEYQAKAREAEWERHRLESETEQLKREREMGDWKQSAWWNAWLWVTAAALLSVLALLLF